MIFIYILVLALGPTVPGRDTQGDRLLSPSRVLETRTLWGNHILRALRAAAPDPAPRPRDQRDPEPFCQESR